MKRREKQTVLQLLRPYPWAFPLLSSMGVVASLAEGVGIGMLIPLLQLLLSEEPAPVGGPFVLWLQTNTRDMGTFALSAAILGLVTAKAIITFGYTVLGDWLNGRVAHDLRVKLFRELLHLNYGFLTRQPSGRMVDTLQEQTWRAGDVVGAVAEMIVAGATIIVFLGLLLMTSWSVTLGLMAGAVLATGPLWGLAKRARRLGRQSVGESKSLAARTVSSLRSMRVIRAFGQEEREWRAFSALSDAERVAYVRTDITLAAVSPLMEVLYLPLLVGALVLGWQLGVTLPVLVTCLALFYRLQPRVQQFQQSRAHLASLLGSVEDVHELLEQGERPRPRSGSEPFAALSDAIRFEGVRYRYGEDQSWALDDVSFEIPRGQLVAVVGGSGSGKTTLVNLLARLWDPTEGAITVDGRPLCELSIAQWRRRLVIAGQDAGLVDGTIAENIAYGKPDATLAEITSAARRAEALDFIEALPGGLETAMVSDGQTLSAGQRQRIGLARALLLGPCVLVLDEATSFLDNATAAAIHRTVRSLRGELTLLVIAHRLESVLEADSVVVLSDGRVVEYDAPEKLLQQDGPFAKLYALERDLS